MFEYSIQHDNIIIIEKKLAVNKANKSARCAIRLSEISSITDLDGHRCEIKMKNGEEVICNHSFDDLIKLFSESNERKTKS